MSKKSERIYTVKKFLVDDEGNQTQIGEESTTKNLEKADEDARKEGYTNRTISGSTVFYRKISGKTISF